MYYKASLSFGNLDAAVKFVCLSCHVSLFLNVG